MPLNWLKTLNEFQMPHQMDCISCAIDKSWLMQESPRLKPDWFSDVRLLSIR